jgi:hypothetical protein
MDAGPVQNIQLQRVMNDKASLWSEIVARYGLQEIAIDKLVNWAFGDYVFHTKWDVMASTIKARQHGFGDCLDTEDMFIELLQQMQERSILPRFT